MHTNCHFFLRVHNFVFIQGLPNDFEKRLLYHLPIELSIVVFNEKLFSTLEVNKNTDLDVLKLNKNLVYLNTHLLLY